MLNFQDKAIELVMKLTDFITGHEAPAEVSASTSNSLAGVKRSGLDKPGGWNANVI